MPTLTRRQAITAAGAALLTGTSFGTAAAQEGRRVLRGRLKQSVCRWCYDKIPLRDFFRSVANLGLPAEMVHPPRGVYAGRARAEGVWYAAAIDVGVNPQFGGDPDTTPLKIEAYLLDYSGDLYERPLRVEFHRWLREEQKFPSVDDLLAQMKEDIDATRALGLG